MSQKGRAQIGASIPSVAKLLFKKGITSFSTSHFSDKKTQRRSNPSQRLGSGASAATKKRAGRSVGGAPPPNQQAGAPAGLDQQMGLRRHRGGGSAAGWVGLRSHCGGWGSAAGWVGLRRHRGWGSAAKPHEARAAGLCRQTRAQRSVGGGWGAAAKPIPTKAAVSGRSVDEFRPRPCWICCGRPWRGT